MIWLQLQAKYLKRNEAFINTHARTRARTHTHTHTHTHAQAYTYYKTC